MERERFTVAMVHAVFHGQDRAGRLESCLRDCRVRGADLALLPELPFDRWAPAEPDPSPADAEAPEGPRHQLLSRCAREAGLAVLAGAIVIDPVTGKRHNTALLVDGQGQLLHSYRKVHLPHEPGFWEASHYEPGPEPPAVVAGLGFPLGIQLCSDAMRPVGTHLLAAAGARAILVPRATEAGTYERWKLVFRANALTSGAYVISVNRPGPEGGVPLGGPSVVVAPDGQVILETEETIAITVLESAAVERSLGDYPGYLLYPAGVYARGWSELAASGATVERPVRVKRSGSIP